MSRYLLGLFISVFIVACSSEPLLLDESASPYVNKTCPTGIISDPDVGQALPRRFVSTLGYASGTRVHHVPAGGNLQATLNTAQAGDVITLEAGATYTGPFTLPKFTGTGWVEIRPQSLTGFPLPGQRIKPSHAPLMPKLVSAGGSVISAAAGAERYRLVGLEVKPTPGTFLTNLIDLGSSTTVSTDFPNNIILDRMYVHGDPVGTRRGVALNGRSMAVIDSYFSGFREQGADSQAIAGWLGPGPYKIINNTLIAASENVIFGGGDPTITNLVPSDIEICYNFFTKPLSWKTQSGWVIKNLFELKNARRVLVAANIFENSWADGQVGFAIVLKSSNQDGTAPWSITEDLTFVYNLIQNSGSGIDLLGQENGGTPMRRILIQNNVLRNIDRELWGGDGRLFQIVFPGPINRLKIDHMTAPVAGNAFLTLGDEAFVASNVWFTNNIVGHGEYGAFGSGQGVGNGALNFYLNNYSFRRNAIIAAESSSYPADNFSPALVTDVGFLDYANFKWQLAASSPYNNAGTDGKDLGADVVTLNSLIKSVRRGY